MALQKHVPPGDSPSVSMKPLKFSTKVHAKAQLADFTTSSTGKPDVNVDLREVYFLIMHFLSAGPCHRTYGQFWNELLEHQLLPRRYHAWYSRNGIPSGDENDDGFSLPLSYNKLVERYPHTEKDHLVKLLKQLILNSVSPSQGISGGHAPNAGDVPTLLGACSFSLLGNDRSKGYSKDNALPDYMRWPHMRADQVRGLALREIGGGFSRHHRGPSIRAASYAIAKPSTMVQKMQNIKRLRGHRNAVYCALFDCSGRRVITGSDDRLVKIWSMETAYCLASCRGHEGDITDLAVSSNNILVASSSNDCVIRVWRLTDGMPISVLRGHTGAVTAIAFSPRPGSIYQLLSSSDDGTCRIWDATKSQVSPRVYVPRPADSVAGKNNAPSSSTSAPTYQIFCCAYNANGSVFVTGSSDNLARVWHAFRSNTEDSEQPNHELDVLSGHENDVNYVQFSGCSVGSKFCMADNSKEENLPKFKNSWFNHDNIVTCSRDGSAIIWVPRRRRSHGKGSRWIRAYHLKVPPPPMPPQPIKGGPRQRILPPTRGVNMITWSLDNRFVLAAIMDCRICVWNAADGSLVHSLTGHSDSTYVLDVHPFNPRIAMSAGYDGKTIVWDIWEGTPIRVYEVAPFKLVDGKFSPDGTSIILSDDVGQLYILNTGQGESQMDAKYDQFFLGDYRPLIQDTHGNVLDQETQLSTYVRNIQDLLCDSGMLPYPEPYQSMYQQRRLGALGIDWRPSSLRLAIGTDITLDQEYQMLPIADLEILPDPLLELMHTFDWEPEIEVQSDDTDSEYNVTEEISSGGEQASLGSKSSDDLDCSGEDSDAENITDGFRRSKRKKAKADNEMMTSSGRRVKRRNLDKCDGNLVINDQIKKSSGRKGRRRKSPDSKSSRPQRAAARNALTLFSRLTGTSIDREDEVSYEDESSGKDSRLQDSYESDESGEFIQHQQSKLAKGKELVSLDEPEEVTKYNELPECHTGEGNRRRLILKFPIRDSNKIQPSELAMEKCDNQENLVGSTSEALEEVSEANCSGTIGESILSEKGHLDISEENRDVEIRWGGVKARTSKRIRLGEAMISGAYAGSSMCINPHKKNKNENDFDVCIKSETQHLMVEDIAASSIQYNNETDPSPSLKSTGAPSSKKIKMEVKMMSKDHEKSSKLEIQTSGEVWKYDSFVTSSKEPSEIEKNQSEGHQCDGTNRTSSDHCDDGLQNGEDHIDSLEMYSHSKKKMYDVVYKRSKTNKSKSNQETNTSGMEECTSNACNVEMNAGHDVSEPTTINGSRRTRSMGLKSTADCSNSRDKCQQIPLEEWTRSTSRTAVGLRSTRSRRGNYNMTETSPIDRRLQQSAAKKQSWLMLSSHEGSRYIPQLGDEVAYLRQGHDEYLEFSCSKEIGPWVSLKSKIRDVEFCKIIGLAYDYVPGSGESCCKMTLQFVDIISNVHGKTFKLTLPEVISFPDFLVERTRFDAAIKRNWSPRDKCQVWWKNDGEEDGAWWDGRILSVKPKSPDFPESPWEMCVIKYKSDPTETHSHSPWELHDADSQWEQPHIDDVIREKMLSFLAKLDRSGDKSQDQYGVNRLKQVSDKTSFRNRSPVPLSFELIHLRMENNYYRSLEALKHDIDVMLSIAESYFEKNAELSPKIRRLSEWFTRTMTSL